MGGHLVRGGGGVKEKSMILIGWVGSRASEDETLSGHDPNVVSETPVQSNFN